jgi:hypothetical protein
VVYSLGSTNILSLEFVGQHFMLPLLVLVCDCKLGWIEEEKFFFFFLFPHEKYSLFLLFFSSINEFFLLLYTGHIFVFFFFFKCSWSLNSGPHTC